ncbi:MAG TPA: GTP cyclohydrolase I [Candidatus Enterocola sp.]|jgi:GTP cyclohydrolase I|nr:MAG: GTP cyclohydrolase 1 [Bacteroidetes bacterium ADurb.Bin302]HOH95927.1 GTP cyclohydrolase I [Candidatus Enterocola sp.]HPG54946.1 GTP cyclohydrolase I [Candidatus Enterocola sp.]
MDKEKIAYHIREILVTIGEDPEREGLRETPERVARMYEEMFRGIAYTNAEIAEKYAKTFDEEDMCTAKQGNFVLVSDIPIFSFCEHHMALMYNMKVSVIYRPVDKIIGLSKIARIAEMVSHRLQLQERIGTDIAEIMTLSTGSNDVGVLIEGEHSCMTARGIKKPGAKTITTAFKGAFETNDSLRREALMLLGKLE